MPLLFVGRGMEWGNGIQVVVLPVARLVRVMWALVDGVVCGGVAEGGVGDTLGVGVGDAGSIVGDAPVVSACSVREGAVGSGIYGWCGANDDNSVGVVDGGSGRELAPWWSWARALATPGGGIGRHLCLVGVPVSVVLAASGVWACSRHSCWGASVLSMPLMFAVAGG